MCTQRDTQRDTDAETDRRRHRDRERKTERERETETERQREKEGTDGGHRSNTMEDFSNLVSDLAYGATALRSVKKASGRFIPVYSGL